MTGHSVVQLPQDDTRAEDMSIRADSPISEFTDDQRLRAIRIIWLFTACVVLLCLVPELQATFVTAERLCIQASCSSMQLTWHEQRALQELGISLNAYAAYSIALSLIDVILCYAVASAMMLRRSGDRMMLMTAFAAVLCCTPSLLSLHTGEGLWAWPTQALSVLGPISVALFLYSFPTGLFVPRWTVLFAIAFVVIVLLPASLLPNNLLGALPWLLFGISLIAVQVYRYRRVSNPVQRQQTKFVVLGISYLSCIFVFGTLLPLFDAGVDKQGIPVLVIQSAFDLAPFPVFLGVGLAILRYRLWDIDVLINRTLVYLVLTASLVLLYLGSVVALQAIFQAITGQHSDLAIAISTLMIAALFNPLRHRIHDLIARTFYRRRYDAAQILSAFGEACRDETDLEQLKEDLVRVVEETLQPVYVSLWLRGVDGEGRA